MKKSLKYFLVTFSILIFLMGCGLDREGMASEDLNASGNVAKKNDVESVLLLDSSDDVSEKEKEEIYTEYIKEYLKEKLGEIAGIDNIFITISSEEDVDNVDVEVVFDDFIQDKESAIKNIEAALMNYFPEGTIVTVKEK